MSTTELDDVMALLERVLPNPAGFAERLFQQAVMQWAEAADSGESPAGARDTADRIDPSTVATAPSYETGSYERLVDFNTVLASALGACDCWGSQADCAVCEGEGSAGWTQPDVDLFQEFVGPAVLKMTVATADGEQGNHIKTGKDDNRERTTQGESA